MNMIDKQPRILSPEQLAEWTPAHRRMYARRLPKSWPRVERMLAMSERAANHQPEPTGDEPDAPRHDLEPPPIVITWEPRRIKVAEIVAECARFARIDVREMESARRAKTVCRPRQAAMYLAHKHTSRSLPEIGKKLGGRDHSTVLHGERKVKADLDAGGKVFGAIIAHVERELGVA